MFSFIESKKGSSRWLRDTKDGRNIIAHAAHEGSKRAEQRKKHEISENEKINRILRKQETD